MKKITFLSFVIIICMLTLPFAVFAEEGTVEEGSLDPVVCVDNEASASEITPFKTCIGDTGVARINWLESARSLQWDVDPKQNVAFNFKGEITIYDSSNEIVQIIPVSCTEIVGDGKCGDVESVSGQRGETYNAIFSGNATELLSGLPLSSVIPGCNVAYTIPK